MSRRRDMRRGFNLPPLAREDNSLDAFFKREKKELGLYKTKPERRAQRKERDEAEIERLKAEVERFKNAEILKNQQVKQTPNPNEQKSNTDEQEEENSITSFPGATP
ncbi:hypothetical protein ACNVED_07635 [Legionella sp. D16C41]|uniref:hypothetical protein n=1 Tax=Legionella sp. D16C41 TaxID=3402688 RepID=UPI003AF76417